MAASGNNKVKQIRPDRVERASSEYVKLFKSMHDFASARGVGLTLVLIPVATNIDEDYIRCWKPMRGKGKDDGRGPPMVKAVKAKLDGLVATIDLTDYPEGFQGGSWLFDGHWNEKGNAAAAKIVADYIRSFL